MKKVAIVALSVLCATALCGAVACQSEEQPPVTTTLLNGGFESADLSGWTVEYGDAFNDDCVSSAKTFTYSYDDKQTRIPVGQTGNWYLCGKGFDGKFSFGRTGAIRSINFTLDGDGTIAMKLAGGATVTGKGTGAGKKSMTNLCYVGVYRASDDKLIAQQTNDYFLEHTESYVPLNKYSAGVFATDNFYEYTLELEDYIGEELYLRIVDNDTHHYYGYISVDDIRIGGEYSQSDGADFTKTRFYATEAQPTSQYEILNGGFETGSLAGWEIVEGTAFSHEGVNREKVWWNENITYSRDGNYHYGHYNPAATGVMRSSEFVLGGSGYVSYKLGGCANNGLTYLRFMVKTESGDKEVARFSNFKYRNDSYENTQFPYVPNGMKLLNMVQYYTDLSAYLGETMYIEVVDNNAGTDDLGCITLDSVQTYWEEKPVWYDSESFVAKANVDVEIDSEYQVKNGTFETGDLTGWTPSWTEDSGRIGYVSSASGWWVENLPYNKKGNFLFTGIDDEGKTGTLTSSAFKVGGSGWITYLLGGGGNQDLCYLSVIDAETNTELARYGNRYFLDRGITTINMGSNLANMIYYKADLSAYIGKTVKLQLVDNATSAWGLMTADSFITYYASETGVPADAMEALNILPKATLGADNEYQVLNGDFETGDFTGWTASETAILGISQEEVWWNEMFSYDKDGRFFANGWNAGEVNKGTLTSSAFTVGGSGWMTFKLGGGKNTSLSYVEIIDATTEEVLCKFGNTMFAESVRPYYCTGKPIDLSKEGVYKANMVQYKADLSAYAGREVRIRIVDNAENDWGLLFADSFITYYAQAGDVPTGAVLATQL
ncbi:MAG: hypothetical protein IJY11_02445 [Clostridia bacterium]|nr:hypothetical protein [Clostridia bacterium]